MSFKKLFSSIKEARLPYHLSYDEDELNSHVCFDENLCCQAKVLSTFEIPPDSPKGTILDTSPILRKFASHPCLKTPENTSLDHFDRRNVAAQRKKLAKKYFQNGRVLDNPKIRSQSLQRVMPDELCMFSQYKYTARTAKKKCNLNLWFLLEMTKEIYKAQKNHCLHNLIHDFGSLVFEFMFSPMRQLRFHQFKRILESLEDLENTVQDRLNNKHDCRSATGFAAKDQNHRLLHFKEDLDKKGDWTQLQTKKVPSSSIVNLIPGIFGHHAVKEHSADVALKKLSANADDRVLYEKLATVLSKAKFLMAQIGHLLHYEQLSSSLPEFLSNKDFRRRSLLGIMSTPSLESKEKPDSNGFSRCSTTICVNSMPSIDIEEEKQNSMRMELSSPGHSMFSTRLTNFLFEARSFLDDFDEKVIETRLEKLRNYCVYKAKKWFKLKKKAEMQQKYEKFEIVCKICEQKIHIEKMKEHSKLCCKKAEANKEMRDAEKKLGELVFDAFMKVKELETSLRVDNKNYDKLKVRSRGNTPKALGTTAKLINANLIKETSSRSSITDSTEADTRYFDFLKTNGIRRYNTASLRDVKDSLHRSQTGKSEDLKKCIEELNNSFGQENEGSTPERNQEDMNIDDDANLRKKTYVGRFLEKQNPTCEDNQSTDSSSLPKKKKGPRLELQIYKRGSETNPFITEGVDVSYYSEPPKSDLDTENSEDSKGTDESIGSLTIPQLKKSDSCHGSDETLHNADSNESHTSIKRSPLKIGCKTVAPKKSKFYNQTFFNFDSTIQPQVDKKDEAKEEQKIDPTTLFQTHSSEAALGSVRTTSPNENLDLLPPLLRTAVKTHSMIVHDKKNEEELNNIDTKLTEQMIKLRMQISKKKETIKVYEIIKKEGKKMMNKEPYRWKMERDREDVFTEIMSLLAKIEDHEVKSFSENFFKAFDKRLKSGKTYQDAKKLIENPQAKISDTASDTSFVEKTPFVRTRSLMIPPRQSPASRDFTENQPDNLLDRSLTRSQVKLGKPNNLSGSLYLDDIDKDFENTDDKSRESRLLSDRSFGKQSGELRGTKFNKEDLTPPSPISDISVGCNTYNQLESSRTLGEIDDKYKLQSPFKPPERQHSSETENPDKTDKENQNLDISLTEVRPSLENDFQTMSIDSPTKLERMSSLPKEENPNPSLELKQNIFQLDCSRVPITAEEQASPETPSFDIRDNPSPMIWRTSTAPARQISGFLIGKGLPKNNVDLGEIKIVERGNNDSESDGSSESDSESESEMPLTIITSFPKRDKPTQEEEKNEDDDDDDDSVIPIPVRTASRTHSIVGLQRTKPRDLVGISNLRRKLEESKSKSGSDLTISTTEANHNHKEGEVTKKSSFCPKEQVFAEDLIEQTAREEIEEKCDSPILESSLLQKGYFSDTQVKNVRVLSKKHQAIGMESFEPVKLISKGAFGRVWLVRRKATNDLYAMKVVNLAERSFKNTQELENLRKENKVFGLAQEDFVVRALFTFIHDTCICFVMEYMIGGDFGDILYTYTALDEDVARFYIAEIVLALEYLHSIGIVHRDLKPDNILLDKHGHAKLTDFGLSETGLSQIIKKTLQYEPESPMICQRRMKTVNKLCSVKRELDNKLNLKVKDKLIDRTRKEEEKDKENPGEVETSGKKKSKKHQRLIGTPDYMAPEIILGKSITTFSIDWWSLGVMLFEFLCGIPPFNDDTPEKIYENIVKLNIPWDQIKIGYDEDCMTPEAADLIKNLLVLDHTKRLGANGADEIKKHPFFKGINWETLRKETAKIIHEQTNETDTTNFIRMNSRINEKEKVNPFEPSELTKTSSNVKDAKEFLEASVDKFDMFNYVALNSDNLKNVDETLKEKERILDELKKGCDDKENKKMYDDIFDTPK